MEEIKAIETFYNGYRFRSRLEARWAVMFDAMGIKWSYETEGFTNGQECYLPDFYLPEYDWYVEVKSLWKDEACNEIKKAIKFVDGKAIKALLILGDIPDKHPVIDWWTYPIFYYSYIWQEPCLTRIRIEAWMQKEGARIKGVFSAHYPWTWVELSKDTLEPQSFYDCSRYGKEVYTENPEVFQDMKKDLERYYDKARQARFEHGECG